MALYTKAQFAELCGLTGSNITEYTKRKNIVQVNDMYDDQDPKNMLFLKKRSIAKKRKEGTFISELLSDDEVPEKKNTKKKEKTAEEIDFIELERQKLTLDIQKKTEEIEILKLRAAKQAGLLVPIAQVDVLFGLLTQALLNTQKETLDRWLINIAAEARLSDTSLANLRKHTTNLLNEGSGKAIDTAKHNLVRLAEEHALTKEIGEHD